MDTSIAAYNHAETIQKLERLNQLETVTAEQRIRIEKYRTMYETLKAESEQLQDDKQKQESDMLLMREEMKALHNRCQELVGQARGERDAKIDECEELRMKVLTPQQIEVMKIKMQEEVDTPYKQKIEALETEVDKYRNEFNRLRYDYSFLKSEYEHELAQKNTMMDEIHGKFELEKETLNKQIKSLNEKNNQDSGDVYKVRMLQKENTQLNLRVKSLLTELEELRDQKETANLQTDQASRLQARQLSELTIQCKSLEAEKETLKLQLDRIQKEINNSIKEQDTLSTDLHRLEKENLQLKSQIEEISHNNKMELNNTKLTLMKDRGELEQERDNLRMELNMLKNKFAIQEASLQQLKKSLEEKEAEAIKRVQTVKEEEWGRVNKLETVKSQLESQVSSLEQQKLDTEAVYQSRLDQLTNRLKTERDNKERSDREISNLKEALNEEKYNVKSLQQEIANLMEMKHKYQKLSHDYENVLASEQGMRNDVDKMANTIDLLKKELEMNQEDIQKQREVHQKHILETRKKLDEEKGREQKKYMDLQKEHKELKKKHDKLSHDAKKKNKKLKTEINLLTDEIQTMKTKEDKHNMEKQMLMKNLNFEQERMKRRFDKFRRRQHQFSQVLNSSTFSGFPVFTSPVKQSSPLFPDNLASTMPPNADVGPLGDAYCVSLGGDDNYAI
ncbi:centrosomal protein of 83 kDa-like [Hydractinia symbiolongicarpus]|uniref:centrosomal protein of 83 kDa-like n=1 Tax=Hydractinia symbiolongicarpus TaxID=13093 RepID=UPI002551229B|nr:centrosomal protein of 83 kDa-like [Hydractinia symbiolongicarpus]